MTLSAPNVAFADVPVPAEDVPIPGGAAALARALEIELPDRARLVAELVRLVFSDSEDVRARTGSAYRRLLSHVAHTGYNQVDGGTSGDRVPIALPARVWSEAVFRRPVAPHELFSAVMSDRKAALLAHGLAALDDETLQYLGDRPSLIRHLYEDSAAIFASLAAHLRIHQQRVVPPGGDQAVALWQAVLAESVARPDRFVRALFTRNDGRLAYLYDTTGALDEPRRAFALGMWIPNPSVRVKRFEALAEALGSVLGEWQVERFPFKRPPYDLVALLLRVQVTANGRPLFPASRAFWARVLSIEAPTDMSQDGFPNVEPDPADQLIDAAWLVEALLPGVALTRLARLDLFAFGQRAFASADRAALPDVFIALRAFDRFPMLLLTLDRIGIGRPALYAALTRHAEQLAPLDVRHGHVAVAQFQCAIGLVARLVQVGTLDLSQAAALLMSLATVPVDPRRGYLGGVAEWLQAQLRPALGAGPDIDDVLMQALAGRAELIPPRNLSWEGQPYRFEFVTTAARRLRLVRERQNSSSIARALDLFGAARQFAKDGRGRQAEPLFEQADATLGEALLAVSYAAAWNDLRPGARFPGELAARHDFGLGKKTHEARVRAAWSVPRRSIKAGGPWHVEGAALGLEIALAPHALRRISSDAPVSRPALSEAERMTFVTSLALMNPFALRDADRDSIADAVARGIQRVEAIGASGNAVDEIVRLIAMDGWRARALRWSIRHDVAQIGSLFSMTELLYLGGGGGIDLNAWGMSGVPFTGSLRSQLAAPGVAAALIGRLQTGLLATTVADLNLRVAVWLSERQLPAALAKSVLGVAVQDFVDRVQPLDANDWLTLVRTAQRVSYEQLEDSIAAETAGGLLLPDSRSVYSRKP